MQAALSLKPTAEGAQDFYLTESAIKVSKEVYTGYLRNLNHFLSFNILTGREICLADRHQVIHQVIQKCHNYGSP